MGYEFINKLDLGQLINLKNTVNDEKLRDDFLRLLNDEILKKENVRGDSSRYTIDTIPYYDERLEDKCLEILSSISIEKFFFLTRSFYEKGNNSYRKPALKYLADCFKTNINRIDRAICNPEFFGFGMYLVAFEQFFSLDVMRDNYNNTFNIYNYIKSYIYQCLGMDSNVSCGDIFKDFEMKQLIVSRDLQKVAAYLYQLRGTDGKLRCSIANAGLPRTAKKVSGEITFHQRQLVDAVAFGTTLEKLNAGNYEDSKKLIYLP